MDFLKRHKPSEEKSINQLLYGQGFIDPEDNERYYIKLGRGSENGFINCLGLAYDDETMHEIYELDEHTRVYPVVATKIKYRGVEL